MQKGTAELLEKMARGASNVTNHLGQEMNQIGRSLGDEDTGAALNAASVGLIIGMGVFAGAMGLVVSGKDKKAREFYNKSDMYGGLGVPMDDDGKPLAELMENGKSFGRREQLSSAEVVHKHCMHSNDQIVARDISSDLEIWKLFLFSKQLNKNRVFHGIRGHYPPRMELTGEQFNLANFNDQELTELFNTMEKNGVRVTASAAANRQGCINVVGSVEDLEKSLNVLKTDAKFADPRYDGLRAAFTEQLQGNKLFGFNAPELVLDTKGLLESCGLSEAELMGLLENLKKDYDICFFKDDQGLLHLSGSASNFNSAIMTMKVDPKYKKLDSLADFMSRHMKSEEMTEFTRDFLALKRNLKGFDSIKFKLVQGRYIMQTNHGLEDIIQVLFAANRVLGTDGRSHWDTGLKKELLEWARNNHITREMSASFVYGEHQGATNVQRTLYSVGANEELAELAECTSDQRLFWDFNEKTGQQECIVTNLRGAELESIINAENKQMALDTKEYQQNVLASLKNGSNGTSVTQSSDFMSEFGMEYARVQQEIPGLNANDIAAIAKARVEQRMAQGVAQSAAQAVIPGQFPGGLNL